MVNDHTAESSDQKGGAPMSVTVDPVELARWQGTTDARIGALTDQIGAYTEQTTSAIAAMHADINRRLDKNEAQQAEIKAEVKYTNGSVRSLKEWRSEVQGREQGEHTVEVRVQHESEAAAERRRFTLGTLITACSAAATLAGALAAVLTGLHVI